MSREWKPGDVATVNGEPLTFFENDDTSELMFTNGAGYQHPARHLSAKARPLVVIDPESNHDVARVENALEANGCHVGTNVQAALRSLVTPPRPEEPGLWGVVEGRDGNRWVREHDGRLGWRHIGPVDRSTQWDHILDAYAPVRVLSEGVVQP